MKKQCAMCNEEKNLTDFTKDKTRKSGYYAICKACKRARSKSLYTIRYSDKIKQRSALRYKETSAKLREYKAQHPCACGENEPCCLEFHHRNPKKKDFHISTNVNRNWDTILKEIKKCVVICSNCHKKVHAGRMKL